MEPVSSVIYTLFRGTPRHAEWIVACLEGAWPGLLGERLAAMCRPVGLEGARLEIRVLDAAWVEPLRGCSGDLLERIQQATGNEVRSIKLSPPRPQADRTALSLWRSATPSQCLALVISSHAGPHFTVCSFWRRGCFEL